MLAFGTAVLALVLSVVFWAAFGFLATIAHEGAHAVGAAMCGGSVESIKVNRNQSGVTGIHVGPLANFLATLAGYLGPSLFGLAGTALLTRDHPNAVLWASLAFLILAFVQAANWFTRLVVFLVGGVVGLVIHSTGPGFQHFFAYLWVWLLLFGGFGHVIIAQHRGGMKADDSDTHHLRKMTLLPRSLWSGFYWLASVFAMVYGGGILLGVIEVGR
jgi:hypothetical protein